MLQEALFSCRGPQGSTFLVGRGSEGGERRVEELLHVGGVQGGVGTAHHTTEHLGDRCSAVQCSAVQVDEYLSRVCGQYLYLCRSETLQAAGSLPPAQAVEAPALATLQGALLVP